MSPVKSLFIFFLFGSISQAALVTKDLVVFGSRQVVWTLEYDDITLITSTSPIHCSNISTQNSGFVYATFGNLTNNQAVCPAGFTGVPLFSGSIGLIQITNLATDTFDKLQGYFTWPR